MTKIDRCGVTVTPFGVVLTMRIPAGKTHRLALSRVQAAALAWDLEERLDKVRVAPTAGVSDVLLARGLRTARRKTQVGPAARIHRHVGTRGATQVAFDNR